jgi:hypothetical protein
MPKLELQRRRAEGPGILLARSLVRTAVEDLGVDVDVGPKT